MKTCPACSAENNADSKFCSACGGLLVPGTEATVDHNPPKKAGACPSISELGFVGSWPVPAGNQKSPAAIQSCPSPASGGMGEVDRADMTSTGWMAGTFCRWSRRHDRWPGPGAVTFRSIRRDPPIWGGSATDLSQNHPIVASQRFVAGAAAPAVAAEWEGCQQFGRLPTFCNAPCPNRASAHHCGQSPDRAGLATDHRQSKSRRSRGHS